MNSEWPDGTTSRTLTANAITANLVEDASDTAIDELISLGHFDCSKKSSNIAGADPFIPI